MKATRSCTYPNDGGSGWTVVRGCRVHRLIARRARRLGSRRASHLVDVERKRSCTGSVHSSCPFCTKLKAWTPRTPPSWLAAGAAGRMPAVRRPAMHHSSLCAGAYLKGHRETVAEEVCGERSKAEKKTGREKASFFPSQGSIWTLERGGRNGHDDRMRPVTCLVAHDHRPRRCPRQRR